MQAFERFVVSTGRAGSTLLSKLLHENQRVMSLSGFFGSLDFVDRFTSEPVSGEHLASMLLATDEVGLLMGSRGFRIKESAIGSHHDMAEHRQRWGVDFVPALFADALPLLDRDPVELFDEILAFARKQPTRSAGDQYRAIF